VPVSFVFENSFVFFFHFFSDLSGSHSDL